MNVVRWCPPRLFKVGCPLLLGLAIIPEANPTGRRDAVLHQLKSGLNRGGICDMLRSTSGGQQIDMFVDLGSLTRCISAGFRAGLVSSLTRARGLRWRWGLGGLAADIGMFNEGKCFYCRHKGLIDRVGFREVFVLFRIESGHNSARDLKSRGGGDGLALPRRKSASRARLRARMAQYYRVSKN